jgi:hypothetical protein
MRHKTFLINPEIVHNKGIEVFKCIQKPGEFVITFGGSYHAGFNMGFNCAEAVNFATKNWIDLGIKSKICQCRKDSVQINMSEFLKNVYKKGLIKRKEFEEFNENKNLHKEYFNINKNELINTINLENNYDNINNENIKINDNDNYNNNNSNNNSILLENKKNKKSNSNSIKGSKNDLIHIEKDLNMKRKIKKSEKILKMRKKRVRNNN